MLLRFNLKRNPRSQFALNERVLNGLASGPSSQQQTLVRPWSVRADAVTGWVQLSSAGASTPGKRRNRKSRIAQKPLVRFGD